MATIAITDLGDARRWVEGCAQGDVVEILGDDGQPLAYVIPATEPITEDIIVDYVERRSGPSPEARQAMYNTLQGIRDMGWRYHRRQDVFVSGPAPG